MKITRKIIEIDDELCTGCGDCVPDCAEGSLEIVDGKARLVEDKLCDGLGACLNSCPTGALRIIEREADEFDEDAVETFLAAKKKKETVPVMGCPSARLQSLQPSPCDAANEPSPQAGSTLSHWPIQIRLIPAAAPFLENCDLLVAADCTAVSYPNINRDFVNGRVVMMGCPKFDDAQMYVDRFTEIFQQKKINSVTVMIMEVPCCSAMLQIIKKARDDAASSVPVRQVVVSTRGNIINDQSW
ncbi:MAG TPA: 4Fe-4S dicluster domain-containing protein [Desulfobacteraceae bacterium]|nr:4Fe-4S dicluster domain-containing protein [Desulfobacteraceae bacterium]